METKRRSLPILPECSDRLKSPQTEASIMISEEKSNLESFNVKAFEIKHLGDREFKKFTKERLNKKDLQIKPKKRPVLIPLSKKRKRYAIEYQNKRIGIIKPGIDHWCAVADLQYGAAESKLDSPMLAVNWLVDNYKRVSEAGIIFFASQNRMHYNIENLDWLIKIDLTPYDCLAKINHENNLDFEYFPDLNSAVVF